jgi:glucose/mannose-6-phosphate isomerase
MPPPVLDRAETYERLDPSRLHDRIAGLPEQCEQASDAARALDLPPGGAPDAVVVAGMGGSGIGGALLRAYAVATRSSVPVATVRGYDMPSWLGPGTLVIASSNSGNTEEVVSAFEQALDAGARCVAIATGGRLLEVARERGAPALAFKWDAEPRTALGWSFVAPLVVAARTGVLPDLAADLHDAVAALRGLTRTLARDVPHDGNPAKRLAERMAGGVPVVIAADALAPVAYRWRTQFNENAKCWAIAEEIPEMNHNAPVGYGLPADALPLLRAVLLRHGGMHPRNRIRLDVTADDLSAAGVAKDVVDVSGDGVLAQMLCGAMLGDFVSYYTGLLNGVDPSPVDALEAVKRKLAEVPAS